MRIAAVETGLTTVVACPKLFHGNGALPKPELTLRLTAREDDVRESLYLLSHCGIGGLTYTGCAIAFVTGHGDEDILLRPVALTENFPQLFEIDFKLGGAVRERRPIILYRGIGALA